MKYFVHILCATIIIGSNGCGTDHSAVPSIPDQLFLYSLDGTKEWTQEEIEKQATDGELFHNFPVLGKTEITDVAKRKELMAAFKQGISRSDGSTAKCFWPRHGIRTKKDGKIVDYVICFECLQYVIHSDSQKPAKPIARDPQTLFNKYLEEAGIPLAPTNKADPDQSLTE